MVVTELPKSIEVKPVCWNAFRPMVSTCAPDKSSEFKPVQLEKAYLPMVVNNMMSYKNK